MELWLLPALVAIGVLTDLMLKITEALYQRHAALLIHPICPPSFKRYALLYLMIMGMSVLLRLAQPTPLGFAAVLLPSLFVLLIILTDYEQRLIFNRVLVGLTLMVLFCTPWIEATLLNRLLAAFIGGAVMLFLSIISRGGIGGGDIKLLFVLGLWQGLDALISLFVFGFVTSGLAAALLLLTGRKKSHDYLAYGPYFAFGALLNLIR